MTELLAVVTITIFAVISPGPDFAMVTRNSLLLSRRAGVLTALGIAAGVWVHVAYTLLGVGLLIRQSLFLFTVLKFVGAAYLIWLGIRMLRTKPAETTGLAAHPALSDIGAQRVGFRTNALNPKTTIFVVSLFMQVVGPTTALPVQMGYGAFISAAHLIWFAIVALFFSSGTVRLRLIALRRWIDRTFGALLVGFGALLATASVTR
ncbi:MULTISPECIES: LysE family transporter [unclassified Ensifer]|uniref:LysE family transporter n=1 Tax=unclassified Ensifer TaxID=2633371 RepID=UPI000713E997|nr:MULTISPECIES: LysE family transporter [unclassified Ensifer]KQX44868.1 amino acid transporter [Ensifer sp. Root1298]KQX76710.1 amino acid transporter [Ensifer sp. Root1312]KRC17221.1 amino acid transporter [Ensifer sp. Root74]KRD62252.1 amino acid transporter [Ensifer sp. Root954]